MASASSQAVSDSSVRHSMRIPRATPYQELLLGCCNVTGSRVYMSVAVPTKCPGTAPPVRRSFTIAKRTRRRPQVNGIGVTSAVSPSNTSRPSTSWWSPHWKTDHQVEPSHHDRATFPHQSPNASSRRVRRNLGISSGSRRQSSSRISCSQWGSRTTRAAAGATDRRR